MRFRFAPFLALSLALAAPASAQLPGTINAASEKADEPSRPAIALKSPDPEIARRLKGLFRQLDGLEQVHVQVADGVVTLTGTTLTVENRNKAEEVASRLAGVVSVENEVEIEHRIGRRLGPMVAKAKEIGRDTIAFLPLLLLGLIVLLGFWLFGRLLTRSTNLFDRIAPNPLVQTLAAQIVRLVFIVIGLVLAMRIVGASALLGTVLGAAGVLTLAIGFAVRDTVENYIASILLSIRRPFDPNDHVIIEGMEGRVTRLNSRATFLTSFDGNELRIPNAIVYKAKIINYTQIPERRFEFEVGVGYETDLRQALAIALTAAKSTSGVLATPEPTVVVDDLDASTISLVVRGWVDQRTDDFAKVRGSTIRAVKTAFDEKSISMPAPTQNIRTIDEGKPKPKQVPKAGPAATEEATDTSADHTIARKVSAIRSRGEGEDLLTAEAPKE